MKEYASIELDGGDSIVVEVDEGKNERSVGRVSRRADGVVVQTAHNVKSVAAVVRPVAASFIEEVKKMETMPATVTMELGVKITLSAGAVIASTAGEANFKICLTWNRQ